MTARTRILKYLFNQYPTIVHKGKLELMAWDWGYETSTIDRECRRLAENGKILKCPNGSNHMRYQYVVGKV